MMKKIQKPKAGQAPTFLHSEYAGQVVDAVNAVASTTFIPPGIAKQDVEGEKAVQTFAMERTAMVVDGVAGYYDVVAIPSEAGGTEEEAITEIKDALGLNTNLPDTLQVRAMVVDGSLVSFETITVLVETPPPEE